MPELGVSNAQLILAAKQTAYMVFVSLAAGTVLAMIMLLPWYLQEATASCRTVSSMGSSIRSSTRFVPFRSSSSWSLSCP